LIPLKENKMYMTFRHKLFCITFLSILSIPSNAQEASAKCPENTSKAVIAGGGCLLGATLGTFIFPGVGTAIGCATVSLGSWTWAKFRTPEAVQPKECNTKEDQSKLPSPEEIALNSRTGGKP
jgi:hypothetical protein